MIEAEGRNGAASVLDLVTPTLLYVCRYEKYNFTQVIPSRHIAPVYGFLLKSMAGGILVECIRWVVTESVCGASA